ncbi:MAG: Rrf2 family transcriptional regulator [Myxococcota bacterium]
MLRLNKKTEYALLALRQLGESHVVPAPALGDVPLVTAKAIAARYKIPEMLLAKVLQRLKKQGLVSAAKGSGGGYRLARPLAEVPLLTVLTLFDGEASLVECQDTHGDCQQLAQCDVRGPLAVLNRAILAPLERMSLADLFVSDAHSPPPPASSGHA